MNESPASGVDRRALQLLRELLLIDDPAQRRGELERRCADEPGLRTQVEALLAADADAERDQRFETPLRITDATDVDRPDPDELIDQCIGPFRVIEEIGRGGMGTVYRAERDQAEFRQLVAIKILRRGLDSDDILARFLRERRILAALSHPNLTHLIDGGRTSDGRPWLAMDFVQGAPITDWCDQRRLDPRARIALLLEVADAVQHAHERLVVHRDLKPGNVLVDDAGHVHLLDFGIAKLIAGDDEDNDATRHGEQGRPGLFTPEYAAPEQLLGGPITAATDVYALAVMGYELLTGRLPYRFEHRDWRSIQTQVLDTTPSRLANAITEPGDDDEPSPELRLRQRAITLPAYRRLVRGDLERILSKALATEPERRYASVQAFAIDLRRFLAGKPVTVAGTGWRYRTGKFIARNRTGVALAALSAALLVSGVSGIVWQWRQAQEQAVLARAEAHRANAVRDYLSLMFREARGDGRDPAQVTAREVLERSAGRIEQEFATDPAMRQNVLATMAELYIHLHDYQGARPLLERFVALEDGSSPTSVQVIALDDLAVVELRQGHPGDALTMIEQAVALIEQDRAPDVQRLHGRVRITRGQILRTLGRNDEAIIDLEQALQLTIEQDGAQARQTAVARNSLAAAYMAAARLAEAEDAFELTLANFEQLGLDESSDALNVRNNLGALHLLRGNQERAGLHLGQAMALQRSLIGDSAGLAASMLNHARLLLLRNRVTEATAQMQAAREMMVRYTAADSIDSASAELALVDAHVHAGSPEPARVHLDAASRILVQRLPDAHPLLARAHIAQARIDLLDDELAAAGHAIEQAMTLLEPGGPSHGPHLASTLCLRAEWHLRQGRPEAAIADAGRCLGLRGEYAASQSWELADASVLLTQAEWRLDPNPETLARKNQFLRDLQERLTPEHPRVRALARL